MSVSIETFHLICLVGAKLKLVLRSLYTVGLIRIDLRNVIYIAQESLNWRT